MMFAFSAAAPSVIVPSVRQRWSRSGSRSKLSAWTTGQGSQGLFSKPSYSFDRIVKKTHLVESESGDIESY